MNHNDAFGKRLGAAILSSSKLLSNGGPPKCRVRQCCRKNNIEGCWKCDDFQTCEKLTFLEEHHGTAPLRNLRKLKRQGPAAFVKGKRYWYAPK